MKEEKPVGLKALKAVGLIFGLLLILSLYGVMMLFLLFKVPVRVYFAFFGGFLFLTSFWLILFFKSKKARKTCLICAISLFAATGIAVGSTYGYEAYLNSIALVDNSNIDTRLYLPFRSDSKIARLEEEASLRFSPLEKLPKVDGAAALFPMYSSFVNAVYPSSIPELNREDGCFFYTNTIQSAKYLWAKERDVVFGVNAKDYANWDENPEDIVPTPIGREGFVFFTNVQNKVDSLTQEQLRGIYSGRITNWKEVGGDDIAIRPYQRNGGSGSQQGMIAFMGDEKLVTPPSDEYVFDLMSGIISAISSYHNHPGAIGYSYHYYARVLKGDNNIKLLGVDGVSPDAKTIGSNQYPLTSSFYANSRKDNDNPNTQKLIDWVLSKQGQELVEKSGYAPLG